MTALTNVLLVMTATTTALITGVFYTWSCSVNLGLKKLPDAIYIAVMQAINKAILNPVFFISFLGTAILLPVSTFFHYAQPISNLFLLLLGATLTYFIGGLGVTIFGNVPLNNTLGDFILKSASEETIAAQRVKFESRWNNLNTIRTIASTVSLVLVIIACLGK